MLEQLKEGTEEQNKERASRNLPELETRGWVENRNMMQRPIV